MDLHMERGVVMGAEIYQRELGVSPLDPFTCAMHSANIHTDSLR